jgi:hypothetical protein
MSVPVPPVTVITLVSTSVSSRLKITPEVFADASTLLAALVSISKSTSKVVVKPDSTTRVSVAVVSARITFDIPASDA